MTDYNDTSEFSDEYEEPEIWDEYRWEEFIREADKRTEKYMQVIEKYSDHPDRDRLIAIEMGWDHLLEEMDEENDLEDDFFFDEVEEGEKWKHDTGYDVTEFDSYENFPVYQQAYNYTIEAMELINTRFEDIEDDSVNAFAGSVIIPPAKIAGGFGFGFEMESLGGNIANCKRGLNAANRTLTALQELRDKKILDQETFQNFYSKGKEVRDDLAIYIVDLRDRFRRGFS